MPLESNGTLLKDIHLRRRKNTPKHHFPATNPIRPLSFSVLEGQSRGQGRQEGGVVRGFEVCGGLVEAGGGGRALRAPVGSRGRNSVVLDSPVLVLFFISFSPQIRSSTS